MTRPIHADLVKFGHLFAEITSSHDVSRSVDIWRVEDGKFVEHWDELNTLDVFIQIGAVSPPRQPS